MLKQRQEAISLKRKLKYLFFAFRWFLIGRYHCEIANIPLMRASFAFFHKVVWGIIIFSLVMNIASFLQKNYGF